MWLTEGTLDWQAVKGDIRFPKLEIQMAPVDIAQLG